jgi:peptide/nickel transport system permease protein
VLAYVIRRTAYGALTILGVLGLLFALFFLYAEPVDMAQQALGEKAPPEVLQQWIANHGYDRPALEQLVDHYRRMLTFDFGRSDADDAPIARRLREGAGPSLAFTVPTFLLGLPLGIALSLFVAYFRDTYIDRVGVVIAVLSMSVSVLLYIIGGQFLLGKLLHWFPISGFDGDPAVILRFIALPVMIGVAGGVGSDVRFYRTVFVEETSRDYVRTARAKGCGDGRIMARHVLRNAMIPILTRVVVAIPFLFTGSLLVESFFGIPGLGAMTVEAIQGNDFSTLRVMVYIGALAFVGFQILTDVAYTLVSSPTSWSRCWWSWASSSRAGCGAATSGAVRRWSCGGAGRSRSWSSPPTCSWGCSTPSPGWEAARSRAATWSPATSPARWSTACSRRTSRSAATRRPSPAPSSTAERRSRTRASTRWEPTSWGGTCCI